MQPAAAAPRPLRALTPGARRGVFIGWSRPSVHTTRLATTGGTRVAAAARSSAAASAVGVGTVSSSISQTASAPWRCTARASPAANPPAPPVLRGRTTRSSGRSRGAAHSRTACAGAVGGGVVDDDDEVGAAGLGGERVEPGEQQVAAVVGDDDGDDTFAGHRDRVPGRARCHGTVTRHTLTVPLVKTCSSPSTPSRPISPGGT